MKILVSYRAIPQSPGWATGDMVVKAFRKLGHEVDVYAKSYKQNDWLEDPGKVLQNEYDLFLFLECNDGDPQYTELRNIKAKHKACWLFDASYHNDLYTGLVNHFGFHSIFLANPLVLKQYESWGYHHSHYLPYAVDPQLHFRPINLFKKYDVAMVGSIREDRKKLADDLRELGVNVKLIDGVYREEYVDALASSRVIINQNPEIGRGLLNMRHFEAQAAGAILIDQTNDIVPNEKVGLGTFAFGYKEVGDIPYLLSTLHGSPQRLQESFMKYNTYQNRCETIYETLY